MICHYQCLIYKTKSEKGNPKKRKLSSEMTCIIETTDNLKFSYLFRVRDIKEYEAPGKLII